MLRGEADTVKHAGWRPDDEYDTGDADPSHRQLLTWVLRRAAIEFRVDLVGEPRFGWRDRSVGSRVDHDGVDGWLRVVGDPVGDDVAGFWDGNATASARLSGLQVPRVHARWEYTETRLRFRADLMDYVDEPVCSPTAALTGTPPVTVAWWARLRGTLNTVARADTDREALDIDRLADRIGSWDRNLPVQVERWVPAHGDLHWGQLSIPTCWVLDWEGWGLAPAGFDAASLYLHSLAVPHLAEQVRVYFGEQLDTRDGMLSQLYIG
jgi:hypothetical protein